MDFSDNSLIDETPVSGQCRMIYLCLFSHKSCYFARGRSAHPRRLAEIGDQQVHAGPIGPDAQALAVAL